MYQIKPPSKICAISLFAKTKGVTVVTVYTKNTLGIIIYKNLSFQPTQYTLTIEAYCTDYTVFIYVYLQFKSEFIGNCLASTSLKLP